MGRSGETEGVIMPGEMKWSVGGRNTNISTRRAKYAPKQKVEEGMSESAKAGVDMWNDWWEVINDNNLWKDKKKR